MLLVVFGAGASYDSAPSYRVPKGDESFQGDGPIPVEQNRPPLADGLFENRGFFSATLTKFPKCQPLVPYLRHLPATKSLEQVLAEFLNEASPLSRTEEADYGGSLLLGVCDKRV